MKNGKLTDENVIYEGESGFTGGLEKGFEVKKGLTDVEVLRIEGKRIIAKGRRFGRFWLLIGLPEEWRDSPEERELLQREFAERSGLTSQGIVRTVGFEEFDEMGPCIIMEWIEGVSLETYLTGEGLSRESRERIISDLLDIVGYLHKNEVTLKSVKSSDFIISKPNGRLVLTKMNLIGGSEENKRKTASRLLDLIGSLAPEHTSKLKKAIESGEDLSELADKLKSEVKLRRKRGIQLLWLIVGAVLFSVAGVAWWRVRSIKETVERSDETIRTLRETGKEHVDRITELRDSLKSVGRRLDESMAALSKVAEETPGFDKEYIEACRKIDMVLEDFDRRVMPGFELSGEEFYDARDAMLNRLGNIQDNAHDPMRYPDITDEDIKRLQEKIYLHATTEYSHYYSIWMGKLMANENRLGEEKKSSGMHKEE